MMPAYYIRNEEADRGIAADYYKCVLRDADGPRRREEWDPTPKMSGYRDCRSRNGSGPSRSGIDGQDTPNTDAIRILRE